MISHTCWLLCGIRTQQQQHLAWNTTPIMLSWKNIELRKHDRHYFLLRGISWFISNEINYQGWRNFIQFNEKWHYLLVVPSKCLSQQSYEAKQHSELVESPQEDIIVCYFHNFSIKMFSFEYIFMLFESNIIISL